MPRGPCAKQVVTAIIVALDGRWYKGENDCAKPQTICPRNDLPTGVGYHLCREVCKQDSHAEVAALQKAGTAANGATLYLSGHYYACNECKQSCDDAGIVNIVLGKPPKRKSEKRRFSDNAVTAMRELYHTDKDTQQSIADLFGVARTTVQKIVNGDRYADTFTGEKPKPLVRPRARKFTPAQVKVLRDVYLMNPENMDYVTWADFHHVSVTTIRNIVTGKTYQDLA